MNNLAPLADEETSSDDYRSRFSGAIGEWLIRRQSEVVESLLDSNLKTALDVGGGHGHLVEPLTKKGMVVTVVGSSENCTKQIEPLIQSGKCTFKVGNLLSLPFPDKSFDLVTCIRFISHCDDWRKLIGELTRVARKSVIVDYPPLLSSNIFNEALFSLKKSVEGNTRPFSVFKHQEILSAFQENNFTCIDKEGEFFLPMVLHRLFKSPSISELLEAPFHVILATKYFGSPTLARFDRT